MFVPMIATLIVLLVITAYMSSNAMVGNAINVKLAFEKAKFTFNVENMIKNGVDSLCQNDPDTCKNAYDSDTGIITLTMNDISPYIPSSFDNSNLIGGSFGDIEIKDNNATISLQHNIPNDIKRNVYLHHYKGLAYSIAPECVSGDKDAFPPCDNENVLHDYPTSPETRTALQ